MNSIYGCQSRFRGYSHAVKRDFRLRSRMVIHAVFLLILGVSLLAGVSHADDGVQLADTGWEAFMSRQDMVWEKMPRYSRQGVLLGNGELGATIVGPKDNRSLEWVMGRPDIRDHYQRRFSGTGPLYDRGRLPVGSCMLTTQGKIKDTHIRLDLFNAETRGTLTTTKGEIGFRSFIHADLELLVIEVTPTAGEEDCNLVWSPAVVVNPRKWRNEEKFRIEDWNPDPRIARSDRDLVCTQRLDSGGDFCVWIREFQTGSATRRYYVTVQNGYPDSDGRQKAEELLAAAEAIEFPRLLSEHRNWWNDYYKQSFVSLPDARMENYYWLQMYKLAAATRADREPIDLMGVWWHDTRWPAIWWNLNIQLTYWPVYTANRLAMGESLTRLLVENMDNLSLNVPEEYQADSAGIGTASAPDCRSNVSMDRELGNLTWACHDLWLQYRHSMDDRMLREELFPLLVRSVNLYLHILEKGSDGRYHLPTTFSPEYGKSEDCNYDLALLKWGCETLIQACERLDLQHPQLPQWKDVAQKLVDHPVDETGFMIGAGTPYDKPHRHFSHLLMVYPLHDVTWAQEENRELIEKSLYTWMGGREWDGKEKIEGFQHYSYVGAACILSQMHRGDEALKHLNFFLNYYIKRDNTLLPTAECSFAAAQAIHEMLLKSWNDTIQVFPALPEEWQNVSFADLRAQGAFLVSAARRNGRTAFVKVKSLAGEPCVIDTGIKGPVEVAAADSVTYKNLGAGILQLNLPKGESAVVHPRGSRPQIEVKPVDSPKGEYNYFGLK